MKKKATYWGIGLSLALGLGVIGSSGVLPGHFAWAATSEAEELETTALSIIGMSNDVSYQTGVSSATVRFGDGTKSYSLTINRSSGLEATLRINGKVVEAIPVADPSMVKLASGASRLEISFGQTYKTIGSYELTIPQGFVNGTVNDYTTTNAAAKFKWNVTAAMEYTIDPENSGTALTTTDTSVAVSSLDKLTLTVNNASDLQAVAGAEKPVLYKHWYEQTYNEETEKATVTNKQEAIGTYNVSVSGNQVILALPQSVALTPAAEGQTDFYYYVVIPEGCFKGTIENTTVTNPAINAGRYSYSLYGLETLMTTPDWHKPIKAEDLDMIKLWFTNLPDAQWGGISSFIYSTTLKIYRADANGKKTGSALINFNGRESGGAPGNPNVTNGIYTGYLGKPSGTLNNLETLKSGQYVLEVPKNFLKDANGVKNTAIITVPMTIEGVNYASPISTYPVSENPVAGELFNRISVTFPKDARILKEVGTVVIKRDGSTIRTIAADADGWSQPDDYTWQFDLGTWYTTPGNYEITFSPGMFREEGGLPSGDITITTAVMEQTVTPVISPEPLTRSGAFKTFTFTYPEGYTVAKGSAAVANAQWIYRGKSQDVTWDDLGDTSKFTQQTKSSFWLTITASGNVVTITSKSNISPTTDSDIFYMDIPYDAWTVTAPNGTTFSVAPMVLRYYSGRIGVESWTPKYPEGFDWKDLADAQIDLTFTDPVLSFKEGVTLQSNLYKPSSTGYTAYYGWETKWSFAVNEENNKVVNVNIVDEDLNPLKYVTGQYNLTVAANLFSDKADVTSFTSSNANIVKYVQFGINGPESVSLECDLDGAALEFAPTTIEISAPEAISFYGKIRPAVTIVHNDVTFIPAVSLKNGKLILTVDTEAQGFDAETWKADGDFMVTVPQSTVLIGDNSTNRVVLTEDNADLSEKFADDTFTFTVAPQTYENFSTVPAAGRISLDEYPRGIEEITSIFPETLKAALNTESTSQIRVWKRGTADEQNYGRESMENAGNGGFILHLTSPLSEAGNYEVTFPAGFWTFGERKEPSPQYVVKYTVPSRSTINVASWSIENGAVIDAFEGVTLKFEGLNAIESVEQTGMIALSVKNPLATGDDASMNVTVPLVASLNAAKDGVVLKVDGLDKIEIAGDYTLELAANSLRIVTPEGTAYNAVANDAFTVLPTVAYTLTPDPAEALQAMETVTVNFGSAAVEVVAGATARYEIGSIILDAELVADGSNVKVRVPALAPSEGIFNLVIPTGAIIVTPTGKAPQYVPEITATYAVSTFDPEATFVPAAGEIDRELYPQGVDVINITFENGAKPVVNGQAGNVTVLKYGDKFGEYAVGNCLYKVGDEIQVVLPEALSSTGIYEVVIPVGAITFNGFAPSPEYRLIYNLLPMQTVDPLTLDPARNAEVYSFEGVKATFIGLDKITKVETVGAITYQFNVPSDPLGGAALGVGLEAQLQADGKTILFAPSADDIRYLQSQGRWPITQPGDYTFIAEEGAVKMTNAKGTVFNSNIQYGFKVVAEPEKPIVYTTDPAAGATVDEITSVKITFPEMKEYVGSNGSITATDGTTSVTLWDDFSGEGQNFINYVSYNGPIATAGTWTIDIPEGAAYVDGEPFQGCSFTVNVKGVAPKEIPYTTDPAEGATVEAFSTFSITFPEAQAAMINENIKATNGTETITLLKDINKGTFGVEGNTAYFIVNGDPITADGQWTVNIADGDLYADGVKFQGCSVTFTVKAQETPVPVEPTFGEKIYLVGQPQGWDINSAAMPLEKTAEGVYTGTFDIKDGEFMLRFYTELGDWNKNSIGSQEFDGPIDVTMTDGEYSGSFVFGKGSWNIAGWTAAKVTFTVDANTKTVKFLRHAGIDAIFGDAEAYDVYTVTGVCVLRGAEKAALDNLENGLYIINGKKVMIRK